MNFNQWEYLPGLLILFVLFVIIVVLLEKRFFRFVETYWFFKRSLFSYAASFLFLAGIGGLLLSLLDPRGPEEKVKVETPTERTIILMDTSASMLAEDVKPSRLQKAALLAKHFARKAAGHQISIVAFSEIQKKIVPFTNDLDLIDSRLDSIKNLRNQYGSSALTQAIQESIQYFEETGETRGNILVLTDGEETAEPINLKVPKDVRVALVGIGTENGGRIPLDDGRGFRFGYKKERGRDVITKLNEDFFRKAAADIPSAKYWLTNTYSLPSEEILDFFVNEKIKGEGRQDMVIKPVLMEWIVIPSLILLICSYIFKSIRVFTLGLLLIISPLRAQEKDEPELSPEILNKVEQLQRGDLNQIERLKLADDLHKAGAKEEALSLYEENLPKDFSKDIPPEAYLNYGTALLEKGEAQKGLAMYQKLSEELPASPEGNKIQEIMDKNVLSFFRLQEQKKKEQENQKKKEQQDKDQKDQQSGEQNDSQSGQGQQKDQQNPSSGQQMKKDQEQGGEDQKKEEKRKDDQKDQGKNPQDDEKPDENQQNKNKDDSEQGEKKLPPRKLPAKLKQLMSDDRQLQMKMIENGTRDLNKRKSRKSKDW